MQAYVNRRDSISAALAELNKYPVGSKRPSLPLASSSVLQSPHKPTRFTRSSFSQLEKNYEFLLNENELLKSQLAETKKELNTYKNPGSSSLRSVLKYAVPRASRTEIPEASSENQPESE
ncbi:16704_t:CDS:2, partial [Dentiscutata heterogama]